MEGQEWAAVGGLEPEAGAGAAYGLAGEVAVEFKGCVQIFGNMIIVGVVVIVSGRVGEWGRGLHAFRAERAGEDDGAIEDGASCRVVRGGFDVKAHGVCNFDAVTVFPFAGERNI